MNRVRSVAARVGWLSLALLIPASYLTPAVHAEPVVADAASRAPDEATLQFLTRTIPEGRIVRVVLHSGTRVFRPSMFTPAGIAMTRSTPVAADGTPSLLPWQEVERIDVRGSSAGRGAIVGGVVVGLFSAALAVAVASDPSLGGGSRNDTGPVLGVTALGFLTGAGVGALVGAFIPRWQRVYPLADRDAAERARSWSSRGARRR